jgi:hypothetical protein
MGILSWLTGLVSTTAESGPIQESTLPGLGLSYADPDIDLPGNQAAHNWRRLTQSASDLAPFDHARMQEMALYLSDRNPLAKGIVDLITAFVVGEGFTATSKDEDVRAAINRFWDDAQNDMPARIEDLTRELSIYGEQFVLAFVHKTSGRVALVNADPRTVTKVVPHPLASDRPYAVCFTGGVTSEDRWVKIIEEDSNPESDTFGRLVGQQEDDTLKQGDRTIAYYQPPDQKGTILAGCFFVAVNKPRSAMRGRSDLLPVADQVDLYDQNMFNEAERMSFLRAFVFDVLVKGADEGLLKQKALNEPPPKFGSVKYHNENEEWKAVSPDLNSADSAGLFDLLLSLVATGVGLPKLWLNGSMDINRATAQESADPAIKRLTARQRVIRRAIERMVRFALDSAESAGALKPADDGRHDFTVSTPEMSAKDLQRGAASLNTAVQALGMANAADWIDDQAAQEAVVLLVSQLGLDIDLDELRERQKTAAEDAAKGEGERIPDYFGLGAYPGSDSLTKHLGTNGTAKQGEGQPAAQAVVTPQAKEMASVIDTITKSLVALGNSRVIDGEFAQQVVAKLYAALGIEVDLDAMRARLEAEQEEADAAEQEPAGGAGATADDLPEDVDDLIDLDDMALEEVYSIGAANLEGLGILDPEANLREGLLLLCEAFEASLHPRGPGGKFAKKAGGEDEGEGQGGGVAVSPEVEARAQELAAEMIAKQAEKKPRKPRAPKDPNAPKTPRKPATPTMNTKELTSAIGELKAGDPVTISLANGLEVSGTVEVAQSGVAMLKTADGKYAVLHDRLKGVSGLTSGEKTATPGPRAPRKPRAKKVPAEATA